MNRKLRTVPLKDLLGTPERMTAAVRVGIILAVLTDAMVFALLVWKLTG